MSDPFENLPPSFGDRHRVNPAPPSGVTLPHGLVPPYDSSPETFEPGAVRMLDPTLVPDANRPIYVLILADWAADRKLVAPFGPLTVPGSTMELRTNREEPHLAVLSLWNQRVLSTEILAKSWFVERFNEDDLDDVLAVWESGMLGDALPAHLHALTGPPIDEESDPRCEYQREESSIFAALDAEMLASAEAEQPLATNIIAAEEDWESPESLLDVVAWNEAREHKLAARSVERPPFRILRRAIGDTGLVLSLKTSPDGQLCKISVLEGGELSSKVDGSSFVPCHGNPVVLKGGRASCPLSEMKDGYKFISERGGQFALTDLKALPENEITSAPCVEEQPMHSSVPARRLIPRPPMKRPSWHKAQLDRWLYEWDIYRTLGEDAPQEELQHATTAEPVVVTESSPTPTSTFFDRLSEWFAELFPALSLQAAYADSTSNEIVRHFQSTVDDPYKAQLVRDRVGRWFLRVSTADVNAAGVKLRVELEREAPILEFLPEDADSFFAQVRLTETMVEALKSGHRPVFRRVE